MLSSNDIRDMSVLAVTESVTWSDAESAPVPGGALDQRLGAISKDLPCTTCHGVELSGDVAAYARTFNRDSYDCPGHFGHIDLPVFVHTPVTIDALCAALGAFCVFCGRMLVAAIKRRRIYSLIQRDASEGTAIVAMLKAAAARACPQCARVQPSIKLNRSASAAGSAAACRGDDDSTAWFPLTASFPVPATDAARDRLDVRDAQLSGRIVTVTGSRARTVLNRIIAAAGPGSLAALVAASGAFDGSLAAARAYFDVLVVDALPVLPPCARPSVRKRGGGAKGDSGIIVHEFTSKYQLIVAAAVKLRKFMVENGVPRIPQTFAESSTFFTTRSFELYAPLQFHVDALINAKAVGVARPPAGVSEHAKKALMSLATNLKGKTGRFRGNLMGKRVDFSARTVITPDPNIPFDSIAVPRYVASVLTIPERVTPLNRDYLERCCMIDVPLSLHASTRSTFNDDGSGGKDLRFRRYRVDVDGHLPVGKIVERPLRDGDVVLLNRQPTLHGPSIMAVRIVLQNRRSIAFGLSKTKPYNADFDGDEMVCARARARANR